MKSKGSPQRLLKGIIGLAGAVLALSGIASAEVVVVAPTQMGSWSFATIDNDLNPCTPSTGVCGSGSMVFGPSPATLPLGVGSANLQTGPGGGGGEAKLDSSALNGVFLGDLTTLSYSTYLTNNSPNNQQFPYLKLYLTWTANGGGADAIYFEPPYQTPGAGNPDLPNQGATALNTWQTWNVLNGALWDDAGECNPGTSEPPSKQGVCSLSQLSSLLGVSLNNIMITGGNTTPDGDGLSLRVGGASPEDTFNGYVDNVTIGVSSNETTFDFEPVGATPEPGTIALLSGALLFFAGARRKISSGRR